MEQIYDLLVIGGGPGGYPAALKAAKLRKSVALIEKRELGGTCLNRGCIPTKTLLHSAETFRQVREAGRFGIQCQEPEFDPERFWQHKDTVVQGLRDGIAGQLKKQKVTVFCGVGKITDYAPAALPIPGIDSEGVMNSDTVLDGNRLGADQNSRCESIVIIGGGVEIIASAAVKEIVRDEAGFTCRYALKNKKGEEEPGSVTAAGVLVSIGRKPVTEGLFSDQVSGQAQTALFTSRGHIAVDEHFETGLPGIYAAGDAIGGIQLAHVATAEGCRAVEHMFALPFSQELSVIPSCVYTDPEIACVGMTADEAKAAGIEAVTGKYIMSVNGKSVLTLQERGFIKLVAEKGSGRLLGAQLMCARATDMIGELGLAIGKHMTTKELASAVMAHPTFAEGIYEAAESMSS